MSDAMICNDNGVDVDDVYQQLAAERLLRAEYNLPEPMMMGAMGGGPQEMAANSDADDDQSSDEADDEEDVP